MSGVLGCVRVSTEEQAREGVSIEAQEARIRAYCTAKDLNLLEIVRDAGFSGKSLDRPGLERLTAACIAGEVEGVVVVKLDRLTRRTRDLLYLVEDVFQARDIALHSLHETIDTASASGRFFLRIMGALAEMERELVSERTAAALDYKRQRGERLGTTPLGFLTSAPGAAMEPNPHELEAVALILDQRQAGSTYRAIAAGLEARGVRTKRGGSWHPSTVRAVWQSRNRYAGFVAA